MTSLVTAGFYICGLEILRVWRNNILQFWIWLTCCYTIDQWKEASILQMCIGSRYQHTTVGSHTPVTTLYADLDWCDNVRCAQSAAWPGLGPDSQHLSCAPCFVPRSAPVLHSCCLVWLLASSLCPLCGATLTWSVCNQRMQTDFLTQDRTRGNWAERLPQPVILRTSWITHFWWMIKLTHFHDI